MGAALVAAERQRRRQMEKARRVQTKLCPSTGPLSAWSVASVYQPADEVGGDLVDVRPLGERCLAVCIADVTGHGVPAAMGAAILKMLFETALHQHAGNPAAMLRFINERFSALSLEEDFASMLIAVLDQNAERITYASAGHDSGYLLTSGGDVRLLESTGSLLGIESTVVWQERSVPLAPGDRVVLVTDGWADLASIAGTRFGRERLQDLIVQFHSERFERAACDTLARAAAWRSHRPAGDDLSMLIVEWTAANSAVGFDCGATSVTHR